MYGLKSKHSFPKFITCHDYIPHTTEIKFCNDKDYCMNIVAFLYEYPNTWCIPNHYIVSIVYIQYKFPSKIPNFDFNGLMPGLMTEQTSFEINQKTLCPGLKSDSYSCKMNV